MSEERAQYVVGGVDKVRRDCLLPFANPHYQVPTPAEVRQVLKLANLTGARAGELVGVQGRTIRRYVGGEREIPYSVWRLLLIEAGIAID